MPGVLIAKSQLARALITSGRFDCRRFIHASHVARYEINQTVCQFVDKYTASADRRIGRFIPDGGMPSNKRRHAER